MQPEATHPHAEAHEHGGPSVYARTLTALLFLTFATIAVAYVDLGSANVVAALFIATCKAILVALFFMHLRWEKPVMRIIAMAGFLFLGIFILFCLLDFDTRNNFLPTSLHEPTVMPLAPGTAPQPLTILPADAAAAVAAGKTEEGKEEKK